MRLFLYNNLQMEKLMKYKQKMEKVYHKTLQQPAFSNVNHPRGSN